MKNLLTIVPLALVVACSPSHSEPKVDAPGQPDSQKDSTPDVLVEVTGLADVSRVAPGQEFTVAVRLAMAPGWHIFWENPGERGTATEVTFDAPKGFEVSPVRFPGPARVESKAAVSYAYAEPVLLSARVTAPDSLPEAPIRLGIRAKWLACKSKCIPGQERTEITLPGATTSSPSVPANAAVFRQHDARIPRPLANLQNARHVWRPVEGGHELIIYVDGGQSVEFYPKRALASTLIGQALVPGEGVGALHLSFRGANPPRVKGVLRAQDATSTYFFDVDISGP